METTCPSLLFRALSILSDSSNSPRAFSFRSNTAPKQADDAIDLMFVRKLGGRADMAAAAKTEVSFHFFDNRRKRENVLTLMHAELTLSAENSDSLLCRHAL